jgi:hypothetical protein
MISFNIKIDNLILKSEEDDPYKMAQIFFVWDSGDETSIASFDYIDGGDYSITIDLPEYISTLNNFSRTNFKRLVGMIVTLTNNFLLKDDERLSILSVDDQDFGEIKDLARDFEDDNDELSPEEWYDERNENDRKSIAEYEEEYGYDYYDTFGDPEDEDIEEESEDKDED